MHFYKLIRPSVGADDEIYQPTPIMSCWAQRSISLPIGPDPERSEGWQHL